MTKEQSRSLAAAASILEGEDDPPPFCIGDDGVDEERGGER